ncbi:MAG: hypothetical protein ACJAYG_001869 [Oceanicoccus sp.]
MSELKSNVGSEFIDDLFDKTIAKLGLSCTPASTIKEYSHPAFGNLGYLQVVDGGDHPEVLKVLHLRLNFAPVGMEANTVHVITKPESLVPHAIIECVFYDPEVDAPFDPKHDGPPNLGFFMNCVGRADPAVNLKYQQHVFLPLEDINNQVRALADGRMGAIPRLQMSILQPWALAATTPFSNFELLTQACETYVERTLDLIENGVPEQCLQAGEAQRSAMRDSLTRVNYLSPEVDHIWPRMEKMIGKEDSDRLRTVMTSQEVEGSY